MLILAPVIGVASFFLWFRFGTSHTKLQIEVSLQGDTHRGTLFIKVTNLGEQAAKNVTCGVWFQGHGLPDAAIEETVIVDELPAKHEVTHAIKNPGKKVELQAAWDSIVAGAWAENAKMAGERIELAQG